MSSRGRIALVTGGAAGIGRATATVLAARGDRVIVADRDAVAGPALVADLIASGHDARFAPVDLADPTAIAALFDGLAEEGLDVLVNNAGVERYAAPSDVEPADYDRIADTNLRGYFFAARHAIPLLGRRGGAVVNVASVQGLASEPGSSVYAATKAGILGLTRALAVDLAPLGIRVNAVCPGAIRTAMTDAYLTDVPDPAAVLAGLAARIPLGRIGRPEDVADAIAFLASDAAAYVTGSTLTVDGGLLARLAL